MTSEEFEQFFEQYRIKLRGSRSQMVATPLRHFFSNKTDKNIVQVERSLKQETVLTIDISEKELKQLAKLELYFYNNNPSPSLRRIFNTWIEQQENEKMIRDKFVAAKNAYEEYSTILAMCNQQASKDDV